MNFEKIESVNEQVIEVSATIVCCSGSSCKDGTEDKKYDNSGAKSSELYGPKHDSTHSCNS